MERLQLHNEDKIFYSFSVNECLEELEWARHTALLKCQNTFDSWQKRTDTQRFVNIFLGDLAKNILKKMMLLENPNIAKSLIEYDLIRTDNFKKSDKFDLKIVKGKLEYILEVKSSAEKYSTDILSLLNRRLIINVDNIHSHFSSLYTQIIFQSNDLEFFSSKFESTNILEFSYSYIEYLLAKNVKAIFVGYANEDLQKEAIKKSFIVENKDTDSEKRAYADLLVKDISSPDYFFTMIKKYF